MQWVMAATLVCGASMFTSCTSDEDDNPVVPTDEVEVQLQKMTLREKVGQLFYVRPECLDTTIHFNQAGDVDASSDDITAITLQYTNAEAAVGTLQAGADSCSGPRTSSKPSMPWSKPWRTACSPSSASTRASAASSD